MSRFSKRTWGWYFVLLDRKHFKVKLLRFNDKCTCSLQYHHFRNELWLLLYGKGNFQMNGFSQQVEKGDYVKVGVRDYHKFMSIGRSLVLEVQYGEKCEEGDIVRV